MDLKTKKNISAAVQQYHAANSALGPSLTNGCSEYARLKHSALAQPTHGRHFIHPRSDRRHEYGTFTFVYILCCTDYYTAVVRKSADRCAIDYYHAVTSSKHKPISAADGGNLATLEPRAAAREKTLKAPLRRTTSPIEEQSC